MTGKSGCYLISAVFCSHRKRVVWAISLSTLKRRKNVKINKVFIENLDPHVVESLPREKLLSDYRALVKSRGDMPPLILSNRKKELWVRFHSKKDRPGLFLSFVRRLHGLGLSVQEAYVQTYENYGAYDWFKVKSTKPVSVIKKMFVRFAVHDDDSQVPPIQFAVIELVSESDKSAIISFRGKDQRGALLAAAQAIYSAGLEIQAAKVHTWGRQIDDVFSVFKVENFTEKFEKLKNKKN